MGTNFLWNFTQWPGLRFMTEEDMRDIPYPATELGIHIAYKNVEAGSVIGGFLVAPLLPLIRKSGKLSKRKLIHRMGVCGGRGMLAGLLITPIMEYAFIQAKKVDKDGLMDRCYRIRYNKRQLLIDRGVTVAGFFGYLAMKWPGAVLGVNLGLFLGAIYNQFFFDRFRHISGGDQMEVPDPHYKKREL